MAVNSEGGMPLPRSVTDRIKAGEQAFAQLTGGGEQGEVRPPAVQEPPLPEQREQDPPEPQRPEPEAELQTQQPPPDDPMAQLTQRLRTLEGKYNTETASLRGELQNRDKRVQTLTEQVADLTLQLLTVQRTPQNGGLTNQPDPDTLSDDELRDVGPDLVDVIERRARAMARTIVSAEVADLRKQVQSLGGSVEHLDTRAQMTEKERFHAYMDRECPGWREQDSDEGFLAWLEIPDPYSGAPRKFAVTAAIKAGQFARVVSIFKGYEREQTAIAPSGRSATTKGRAKLETLIAPNGGRGRTEAIQAETDAPQAPLTQREIQAFYAKIAKPRHGMSDAEIAAMEARIMRDVHGGRIHVQSRV